MRNGHVSPLLYAAAVDNRSKHAMLKEVWQFLQDEGHINQGILEDEPESQVAGMSLVG